jgi:hypothetical protein
MSGVHSSRSQLKCPRQLIRHSCGKIERNRFALSERLAIIPMIVQVNSSSQVRNQANPAPVRPPSFPSYRTFRKFRRKKRIFDSQCGFDSLSNPHFFLSSIKTIKDDRFQQHMGTQFTQTVDIDLPITFTYCCIYELPLTNSAPIYRMNVYSL